MDQATEVFRKYARSIFLSRKFAFWWMGSIFLMIFSVGVITSLEVKSVWGKIFGLAIVLALFLPPPCFVYFYYRKTKKIKKAVSLLAPQISGFFYEGNAALKMEWFDWFEQHAQPDMSLYENFDFSLSSAPLALAAHYKGDDFLLVITTGFRKINKKVFLFVAHSLEPEQRDPFPIDLFYPLMERGFIPKMQGKYLYFFHNGNEVDLFQAGKILELFSLYHSAFEKMERHTLQDLHQRKKATSFLRNLLIQAGHFTEQDLLQNSHGRISAWQRTKFFFKAVGIFLISLACFSWAFTLQTVPGLTAKNGQPLSPNDRLIGTLIFGFVAIGIFFFACQKFFDEVLKVKINGTQGNLQKLFLHRTQGRNARLICYARVAGVDFEIPWKVYVALIPHVSYTFYSVRGSKKILSIEPT